MSQIYEYAVFYNPDNSNRTSDEKQKGEIILEPNWMLADSQQEAMVKVYKLIPEEWESKMEEVVIAIHPF